MDELLTEREEQILGDPGKRALVNERKKRREAENRLRILQRELCPRCRRLLDRSPARAG